MSPVLLIFIGGGLAVILLIVGIVISLRGDQSVIDDRMDQVVSGEEYIDVDEGSTSNAPITQWINRRVEGSSFADRLSKDLARADLKMKPGEFIGLIIISAALVGFIFWFVGGRDTQGILLGLAGAVLGLFLPSIYVNSQQSRRLMRFDEQLPDMLSLMVNGLRAGFSTMQAMEAVSKELPAPISEEFHRVTQEIQLGISMDKALDNLYRRIPSPDLDLVITAINVQREVGGNLAEIIDTISYTIRDRIRIQGEIRVLTTQMMYSGRFLSLMPVLVILALFFMNRPYIMEFFNNPPCGYIALAVSGFLIVLGYFVMTRLAKIDI